MILYVFTVRDDKAAAYLNPFYVQNEALAIRAMRDCLGSSDHSFAKYPEDYSLYQLGTYDDAQGKFELFDKPTHVANLVDLKGE